MKRLLLVLVLLAGGVGGAYYYYGGQGGSAVRYRTVPVTRGDLLIAISATGTVQPVEVVDVGAQVAGRIIAFGEDPHAPGKMIDYGSTIEEGTVLARIDDSLYAADVAQSSAQVEQAKANVRKAEADLAQMKARLLQAENDWKRAQELGPSRALSATEFDAYAAAYEIAKATVSVGEATVVQTQKSVLQAEATLRRFQTNLGYTTIRSPVKGVIIDRRVNIGQTVVASLNAPSLFLIARDLTKIQVWVAVNEADIGQIHPGQPATFTVDAFPGRTFTGTVGKIRLNASMTQNVVTYTVEINTDNSDGVLLPYLTANVQFEVERRPQVLSVPNGALRWMPEAEQIAPDVRGLIEAEEKERGRGMGGRREQAGTQPAREPTRRVWVVDGQYVRPVEVMAGASDGSQTEIQGEAVKEGMPVVIGELEQGQTDNAASPFTPQFFRNRERRG